MTHTATQPKLASGTWFLDTDHSSVRYAVRHMGIARMSGHFQDFDAKLTVDDDDAASLAGTAKTASIDSGIEQLNGHLKSPDFFDAEQHPTISFELDGLQLDEEFDIEGRITIKGTTKPIHIKGSLGGVIEDPYGNERAGLSLRAIINRHDFGVSWNADMPGGGKVVSDNVELSAELELIRQ